MQKACKNARCMAFNPSSILRKRALRDTAPRRLVLQALASHAKPLLQKDVHGWIEKQNGDVNLVSVYRILERFEEHGIVHRHPSTGGFVLCSLPDTEGHHGFLSCESCGTVKEFADPALCKQEGRIAKQSQFTLNHHLTDMIGLCSTCSS